MSHWFAPQLGQETVSECVGEDEYKVQMFYSFLSLLNAECGGVFVCIFGLEVELAGFDPLSSSGTPSCSDEHPQRCSSQQPSLSFEALKCSCEFCLFFLPAALQRLQRASRGLKMWFTLPSLNWWRNGKTVLHGTVCIVCVLCPHQPHPVLLLSRWLRDATLGLMEHHSLPAQLLAACRNVWVWVCTKLTNCLAKHIEHSVQRCRCSVIENISQVLSLTSISGAFLDCYLPDFKEKYDALCVNITHLSHNNDHVLYWFLEKHYKG